MNARVQKQLRPVFHFSAPSGWLNDPNGFCFFKGVYHLFYQYNPHSCNWSKMYWGHAISKDLIHWEDMPIALFPDQEYDTDEVGGCFSGSAIVKDDRLYVFYTGTSRHGKGLVQSQCMAYSDDGIHFKKYENNPVISYPPSFEGEISNFRDPRVIQVNDKYYMIIGSTTGGLKVGDGRIFMYESADLFKWKYKGILLKCNGRWTSMCECPDLFPLGNKWVLMFSLMHAINAEKTIYAIGDMDFENCKFTIDKTGELDYGMDFYAGQTLLDEKGRRIIIAWANSWEWLPWFNEFGHTEHENWKGFMSFPREIKLSKDGNLTLFPVEEIQKVLKDRSSYENVTITDKAHYFSPPVSGAFCLKIYFDMKGWQVDVLEIGVKSYGEKATIISLDYEKKTLSLDRRNGDEIFLPKAKTTAFVEDWGDECEITLLVDRCSVEVFLNNGETGMTCSVFPAAEDQSLWIKTRQGQMTITKMIFSEVNL